jgi:ABC-2 type transport system permease protein
MIRFAQIKLIANHTYNNILTFPINRWLVGGFLVLIAIALSSSYMSYANHQHDVGHYSKDVRDRWENNPDKHPHRMAHYGYVAFRSKFPLSFFDQGLDNYLGNVMFLEAHRQNSVNFSKASLSSSLLRFGELSVGLLLQLLLPLLIFFWGYASVSGEREKSILKLFFTQGVSWKELLLGKSLGLFSVSLLIIIPALIFTLLLLFIIKPAEFSPVLFSFGGVAITHLIYLFVMSFLATWISAKSTSSKSSLITLIGCWLFFVLIIPKTSQVMAQIIYPSPSKIEFDAAVEHELIQHGDSHNPDDPHFNAIKDSLLSEYNVSSTKDLPFNFGGYIMKEGEKLSTEVFRKHQEELINTYKKQNSVIQKMAILNPYIAIKNISMVLSGTDFGSYQIFKSEAEEYRYNLAQTMNNLQIEHISNTTTSSADKGAVISQQYWKDFPSFEHRFLKVNEIIDSISYSLFCLILWLGLLLSCMFFFTNTLRAL